MFVAFEGLTRTGLCALALLLSMPDSALAQPDEEEEGMNAEGDDANDDANDEGDEEGDDDDSPPPPPPDTVTTTGSSGKGPSEDATRAGDAKDGKKAKKKADGVSLGGRVFVRDTITKLASDGAQLQNDFSLASVRGNIDLRKYGWLRASIEVSFEETGEIDIEDVYARIRLHETVRVQAGRFKRPISPIALASAWDLPITERGLLSDNVPVGDLAVPLNLGGRSEGAQVSYRGAGVLRPELHLGVFNARLPKRGGGDPEIADLADNLLRDVYSRGQVELIDGFRVGGSFAVITRARNAGRLQSKLMGSLDLTIETDSFRAWLEGFAGNSTLFDGVESVGTLLALRVLVAPRLDNPVDKIKRLEPFVIFSALDPTDASDNNRALEIGAGLAVWFRKVVRLQADFTYNAYEDQFPAPTLSFIDRSTVRVQLGSQFR